MIAVTEGDFGTRGDLKERERELRNNLSIEEVVYWAAQGLETRGDSTYPFRWECV